MKKEVEPHQWDRHHIIGENGRALAPIEARVYGIGHNGATSIAVDVVAKPFWGLRGAPPKRTSWNACWGRAILHPVMGGRRIKHRLYVANVRCQAAEPATPPPMIYAVLATTPGDAVRAIRKGYGYECTVEFNNFHGLNEAETIKRLGLEDGRARSA